MRQSRREVAFFECEVVSQQGVGESDKPPGDRDEGDFGGFSGAAHFLVNFFEFWMCSRIPMKPAMHSNVKPATRSDPKPAGVPI